MNWMIGCIGPNVPTPRPFDEGPPLPLGTEDSPGRPVGPKSLYLAQLAERLGPQALKNIGYSEKMESLLPVKRIKQLPVRRPPVDRALGPDEGFLRLANPSNVRNRSAEFAAENAMDDRDRTYWATDDGVTSATLEVDLEGPVAINAVEVREPKNLQHVREYKVYGQVNSDWKLLAEGRTIGDRKVHRFDKVIPWKVRLVILQSDGYPAISKFGLYMAGTGKGAAR